MVRGDVGGVWSCVWAGGAGGWQRKLAGQGREAGLVIMNSDLDKSYGL